MKQARQGGQAVRLARYLRLFANHGNLSKSKARKAIERLAERMEKSGNSKAAEAVSAVYMRIDSYT